MGTYFSRFEYNADLCWISAFVKDGDSNFLIGFIELVSAGHDSCFHKNLM